MRVAAIPDTEILDGHERVVVGPPPDYDPTGEVRSVEMLRSTSIIEGEEWPVHRARVVLEPGDLERLAAGESIWVSFYGHVVPFDVALTEPT